MMRSERLFPVMVMKNERGFLCVIKELSLIESGEDLKQVYERLEQKKLETLKQLREAHLEEVILPKPPSPKKKEWPLFSLNVLLITLLLMVPIVSITRPLSIIFSRLAAVLQLKPIEFVIRLSEHVKSMPLEKKKELKKAMHSLVVEFDQFVEISPKEKEEN